MINTVALTGRLTFNPELKSTANGVSVMSFSIANDKKYSEGANFIPCVAWRQTAEFISRYFHKGDMVGIEGELQTRNYTDRDGNSRTAVEVVVSNVSFCERKSSGQSQEQPAPSYNDYEPIDDDNDKLPWE